MLILISSALFYLSGCGNSGSTKDDSAGDTQTGEVVTLEQPLTGNASLFPNAGLLAAPEDLLVTDTSGSLTDTVTGEAIIIDILLLGR
jgi:hypothetical protein